MTTKSKSNKVPLTTATTRSSTDASWSWIPIASDPVLIAVTCIIAMTISINSAYNDFTFDDDRGVIKNPDLRPTTPLIDLLYHDYWGFVMSSSCGHTCSNCE